VGVGAMMFACAACCLGVLVGAGFGRRSEGVLDVAPRWSFDGRGCIEEEKVLVDCEDEVERPRARDQGLDATL
jgi:hypothetical protein